MKCPKCGQECADDMKFCPNCAYPIEQYLNGVKKNAAERNETLNQVESYQMQNDTEKVNMQMTGQNADENREVPFYNKNLSLERQ